MHNLVGAISSTRQTLDTRAIFDRDNLGGFVTYFVQTRLKRREEIAAVKERILFFVMTTMRIIGDMQDLQNLIALDRRNAPPGSELWQAVHTLQFTPGFKPDMLHLGALTRLNCANLVTGAMHLYKDYASLIETIEKYNEIRVDFVEKRKDPNSSDESVANLKYNVSHYIRFIENSSLALIEEANTLQHLTYQMSKKHFHDANFLILKNS